MYRNNVIIQYNSVVGFSNAMIKESDFVLNVNKFNYVVNLFG